MRSRLDVSPTPWIVALVALTGCGQSGGGGVGLGQTTNTAVLAVPSVVRTSPSVWVVDAPVTSTVAQALEERELEMPTEPASPLSLSPPRYESNGSTFSDVGTPYPLPSVLVEPTQPPVTPPPPAPAPFFETSFGASSPSSSSNGLVESSFGSDAAP